MYGLTIICCVIAVAYGQSTSAGRCPQPNSPFPLDQDLFKGIWFEIGRSRNMMEITGKCSFSKWDIISENKFKVIHNEVSKLTGFMSGIVGEATVNQSSINSEFDMPLFGKMSRKSVVLFTDYANSSVIWSCHNYGLMHISYIWVYSRDRNQWNVDQTELVNNACMHAGVSPLPIHKVEHENCP